ncbi:Thiol-disulfide oxidoreductase ResA [Anatilimnocola aggregata]|uniref:Thiol-disulfide oxidoreductase ResA n=1 Tax=Anatilimnocola aggregata TaxID=2528021 RepID=A0A517Y9E0_9BACT|nr:TlpA disulfide reductase family protein [Anatilimnocola aggregata]QDU26836.1 Thiol-disulfide oxidoreductase ResA [Anatilimnocola aggregata]
MLKFLSSRACCLLLVAVVGCSVESSNTAGPTAEVTTTPVVESAAIDPATISVQVGDEKALEELIKKHKGQVILVDYWATWCHPCVEGFPHTVDAFEKYEKQGLTAIAVSFDDAEEEPKVRKFLAGQRARFDNLISSLPQGSENFERFGIEQVPHYRLYDRTGKLRHKWDAAPKDLDAQVTVLLAE